LELKISAPYKNIRALENVGALKY
jgi:hypothetical protein